MKRLFVFIGKGVFCCFSWLFRALKKVLCAINTGYQTFGMKMADSTVVFEYPTDKVHGKEFISIGRYSSFGKRAIVAAWKTKENDSDPEIVIGDNVSIGDDCFITSVNSIRIGDNVLIAQKVTVTDNSHGRIDCIEELNTHPSKRTPFSKGPVVIENNVWVGDKVTICPNVKIGRGSIIGANSVVTRDVPPYSVAVGTPARIIKTIL